MTKGHRKVVQKSFDFTDVEQRREFIEFITSCPETDGKFLLKVELQNKGSFRGIRSNEIKKKKRRFGSVEAIPALVFFDLEDENRIFEISIRIIRKITILQELK